MKDGTCEAQNAANWTTFPCPESPLLAKGWQGPGVQGMRLWKVFLVPGPQPLGLNLANALEEKLVIRVMQARQHPPRPPVHHHPNFKQLLQITEDGVSSRLNFPDIEFIKPPQGTIEKI